MKSTSNGIKKRKYENSIEMLSRGENLADTKAKAISSAINFKKSFRDEQLRIHPKKKKRGNMLYKLYKLSSD